MHRAPDGLAVLPHVVAVGRLQSTQLGVRAGVLPPTPWQVGLGTHLHIADAGLIMDGIQKHGLLSHVWYCSTVPTFPLPAGPMTSCAYLPILCQILCYPPHILSLKSPA